MAHTAKVEVVTATELELLDEVTPTARDMQPCHPEQSTSYPCIVGSVFLSTHECASDTDAPSRPFVSVQSSCRKKGCLLDMSRQAARDAEYQVTKLRVIDKLTARGVWAPVGRFDIGVSRPRKVSVSVSRLHSESHCGTMSAGRAATDGACGRHRTHESFRREHSRMAAPGRRLSPPGVAPASTRTGSTSARSRCSAPSSSFTVEANSDGGGAGHATGHGGGGGHASDVPRQSTAAAEVLRLTSSSSAHFHRIVTARANTAAMKRATGLTSTEWKAVA